jgi:rare lipoprotein A
LIHPLQQEYELSAPAKLAKQGGLLMKAVWLFVIQIVTFALPVFAGPSPQTGIASWYGESHRGRLMANGRKFNPDKLTAASWFYPLGSKVKVTLQNRQSMSRTVLVTITDRGPAHELVRDGRIIDLSHAAFKKVAVPDIGLVSVVVQRVN